MVTLDHLFNKIQNNTYSTSTDEKLSISTLLSPANSMRTLLEVYTAIPSISPDIIATGTTIMGIPGNVVMPDAANVANGVGFGPSNFYDDGYGGFYFSGYPFVGEFKTSHQIWSNATGSGNWNDAILFCNNLSEGGHAWRLPKDGDWGAMHEPSFPGRYFWSGTEVSAEYARAFGIFDSGQGYYYAAPYSDQSDKAAGYGVRCITKTL
jgi:hypothetical protein